ncbi:MAG TPA: hypothetical protein VFF52_26060 [Isosphaeraceae bacterium]|nr:hypothetical protein [Isosphaeraceae bacterium]
MFTCTQASGRRTLELPDAFEDLTGVISADLKVIVTALGQRAGERLLLSPSQRLQLQRTLWNNVIEAINQTMEPLSVERQ